MNNRLNQLIDFPLPASKKNNIKYENLTFVFFIKKKDTE